MSIVTKENNPELYNALFEKETNEVEIMTEEIKEILDRLERIDHKEYSGGFEFADSGSFDEDCRCFEERKKLANYITNLQKENQILKENAEHNDKVVDKAR